jgi:hypothetical protein
MNLLLDNSKDILKWVVVDDKQLNPEVKNSFRHYYERRIERKSAKEETFFTTADAAVKFAFEHGYKYCLINWEGLLISNQPLYYINALKHINSLNDGGDWLVSGQIIDDVTGVNFWNAAPVAAPESRWYFIWPAICMVNLETWNRLGQPLMGESTRSSIKGFPKVSRSKENVHDNYTPFWIETANDTHQVDNVTELRHGWNILKVSLENNLKVTNIPTSMRAESEYTYPENNIEVYNRTVEFVQTANSSSLNFKLLHTLTDMASRMMNTTFNAFNSEGLTPAVGLDKFEEHYADIDTVVYPTQGFKDFIYTFSNVCKNQHPVNIIHYDLTLDAVKKRKQFIDNWDMTLEYMTNNNLVNFGQNYKEHWKELLSYFDSYEHMCAQWQKYKNCNHYYVDQNLMYETADKKIKGMLDKISAKRILFMYSDIFPWETNLLVRGVNNLLRMEEELLKHIGKDLDFLLTESKGVIRNSPEFIIFDVK